MLTLQSDPRLQKSLERFGESMGGDGCSSCLTLMMMDVMMMPALSLSGLYNIARWGYCEGRSHLGFEKSTFAKIAPKFAGLWCPKPEAKNPV